jgi:hypothetical protein
MGRWGRRWGLNGRSCEVMGTLRNPDGKHSKCVGVKILCLPEERERFEAAARNQHLTVGNWCRKWLVLAVEQSEGEDRERSYERSDKRKARLYGGLAPEVKAWVPEPDYRHD